jgi:hypothetical protein
LRNFQGATINPCYSIIDDAAKGEGYAGQSFNCDCGERITYWQITAQLRKQKRLVADSKFVSGLYPTAGFREFKQATRRGATTPGKVT